MDFYILRHGRAEPGDCEFKDAERRLSNKGKEEIALVAQWMAARGYRFDVIATSPIRRASETAGIVAASRGIKNRITVWESLAPGGNIDEIFHNLSGLDENSTVLLVGHEPTCTQLISRIILGVDNASIAVSKGGLAKIRNFSPQHRPSGQLQWLLTAKQMMSME